MSKSLFVGNLAYDVTSEELQEIFGEFGTVVSSKVLKDFATGRSRGFGFIEFSEDEEALKAMEKMDGFLLKGRPIRVRESHPPKGEDRGRRGGRDRRGRGGVRREDRKF